ncbi:sigma-54 interaction domain-containing protein [Virgibacillus alimentarius]|uniref:PAS domain S-box-containing protein n=1 Tax=Virgibacillus alimentarius TaxID=698769 RepID=A0ABS4S4N8_9BACI|nr:MULTISPECIES: sigma-54-dependent Fis family transcriptional regulator [Virgibacillus]MBP2256458.1 PAS domain S-box-containing protein [Virgibacillus alimentarius]HLR66403.1 sigma-54-dependent Fis family transcriptional regulator [Virgibacillus sp.]
MKRVLIIGVNKNESALFNLLYTSDQFKIIAAIAQNKQENVCKVERTYNIPVDTEWQNWINEDIDIIIETTGDSHLLALLSNERQKQTLIIPEPLTRIIIELLEEKMTQTINNKLTQVIHLKEENTDLKKIKTMLEAIIHSSEEAISVVDENGTGLMVNPAYTKITGLTEKEIIGKPASTDISEGESMHFKVLKTRQPVRGVRMKVGPNKRSVLVNVAPVIVNGKIKGSIGVLHDISEIQILTSELKRAQKIIRNLEAKYTFDDIIGSSPEMKLAIEQAKVGARTPATVLLRGESGTGKELFAHAIHHESVRKHNKFIRVNCAAIAETLLESELFGYEDGAFSGAKSGGKKGLFEEANNGSIFLDEIGELSLNMQTKLLRFLQENEIIRVGGTKPIQINVRVIAATNTNLEKAIMDKTFREDLYYRLNRLPIFIPSLRERLDDLPDLIYHTIEKLNLEYGRNVRSISDKALHNLKQHRWDGNIRELENIIGRAMIYMGMNEERIKTKHIFDYVNLLSKTKDPIDSQVSSIDRLSLQQATEQFEKDFIASAYRRNNFNKTKTASALKISIRNLYYKIKKYNIEKSNMQHFS